MTVNHDVTGSSPVGGAKKEYSLSTVGVDDAEGPPVPIPNTEVKLSGAEDSALATRCENREMPILVASFPLSNEADFYSRLFYFANYSLVNSILCSLSMFSSFIIRFIIVLRDMYPPGTRVECLYMSDLFPPVPSGTKGTVFHVDDMAQIHVNWDNGSSLALNRGEDSFRKLSVQEVEAENSAAVNQDEAPEESSGMKMKM